MNKINYFSVYDITAGKYQSLVPGHNVGGAIRSFGDAVISDDPQNTFKKHPTDYDFYHIGYLDEDTGVFTSLEKPVRISRAVDFINPTGVNDNER